MSLTLKHKTQRGKKSNNGLLTQKNLEKKEQRRKITVVLTSRRRDGKRVLDSIEWSRMKQEKSFAEAKKKVTK